MTEAEAPRRHSARKESRWPLSRVLTVLTAVVGVSVLLYPTAASWFSDRTHATEVSGYVEEIESLPPAEQRQLLDEAHAYNAVLPYGPLRDPYTLNEEGVSDSIGSGSETYKSALSGSAEGVMGTLSLPSIGATLPIFHGTSESTLAKGVGHLFGSALPVGGESTHSVLTAHSGFVTATLFDNLSKMKKGDVFSVTAVNKTIYYKVDQIRTVIPSNTDDLRRVEGKDYITLITCTPTGVNSHRLLVRGERIEAPAESKAGTHSLAAVAVDPGFPWWALIIIGTAAAAILITRPRNPTNVEEAPAISE